MAVRQMMELYTLIAPGRISAHSLLYRRSERIFSQPGIMPPLKNMVNMMMNNTGFLSSTFLEARK